MFNERNLDKTKLPTERDVMEHLLFLRKEKIRSGVSGNVGFSDMFVQVIQEIGALWQRAAIPVTSTRSIRRKLDAIVQRYRDFLKTPAIYVENEWDILFMICQCRCGIELHLECKCTPESRIPNNAKEFFVDQCEGRLLTLDLCFGMVVAAEIEEAAGIEEVAEIEEDFSDVEMTGTESPSQQPSSSAGYQPAQDELEEFMEYSGQFSPLTDVNPHMLKVSDIELSNVSSALDRANVSDRMGALIVTSFLKDLKKAGIDTGVILDRNKIRRERAKARKNSLAAMKCHDLLKCISFDGKREMALKQIVVGGKSRNINAMEEHITMVKEPGSLFMGYVTPAKGDAIGILTAMKNYLVTEDYSLDDLVAILCDGTATNTGNKNGVICQFERLLERPLQWLICLFHFNELPFRALVTSTIGNPSGPKAFPGVIGREIHTCENMPVINLNFVCSPVPIKISFIDFFLI